MTVLIQKTPIDDVLQRLHDQTKNPARREVFGSLYKITASVIEPASRPSLRIVRSAWRVALRPFPFRIPFRKRSQKSGLFRNPLPVEKDTIDKMIHCLDHMISDRRLINIARYQLPPRNRKARGNVGIVRKLAESVKNLSIRTEFRLTQIEGIGHFGYHVFSSR